MLTFAQATLAGTPCPVCVCVLWRVTSVTCCLFCTPAGISAVFTIFASFVFGSGVVNLLDYKASGLQWVTSNYLSMYNTCVYITYTLSVCTLCHTWPRCCSSSPSSEALPFFLLLMDLSKATYLAQYASTARTKVWGSPPLPVPPSYTPSLPFPSPFLLPHILLSASSSYSLPYS